jgi:uncharacterized protein (UPF0371 family)
MQHNGFEYQSYFVTLSEQLQNHLAEYSKLYLEITGNLIDQSNITEIFPDFEANTYKNLFAPWKYEMDILLCIKAQDIIDNQPMGEGHQPFRDFLQIYLKKIENQF